MVVFFKADFSFCGCSGVLSVGVLKHKGMVNETFFFFELLVMESIACVLASLGTFNLRMPRWMDMEHERSIDGLVESLNM